MSHKEKENAISLISGLLVSVPFLTYTFLKFKNEDFNSEEELKFWATSILYLVGIRIVGMIVLYILFYIGRAALTGKHEQEKEIVDERDRIIELKGERNTSNIFFFGLLLAVIAIAFAGAGLSTLFMSMFIFGFVGEVFGTLSKFYYYNGGLKL